MTTRYFAKLISRIILLFLLVHLLLLVLSACSQQQTTWQRIQETGVLRVGLDPTYPPFELYDGKDLFGLDVDLSKAIARDLGLHEQFVHFGYDGLYDALATNQVDVLVSALVVIPERTRDFAYSDTYFNAGQVLVTQKNTAVTDIPSLNGRILAVELGAQGHVLATSWQRQLPVLEIQVHGSSNEALASVNSGEADAAVVDHVSARLFLTQSPDLIIRDESIAIDPYAMVVRAEDEQLLKQLDQSLGRLRSSGSLENIISKWLDA